MKSSHKILALGLIGIGLSFQAASYAANSDISGVYHVDGENPDGSPYRGTLRIERHGETYGLTWGTGSTVSGVGILYKGTLVAGYGDPACGVVVYDRQPNGALQGTWAFSAGSKVGTETATRAQGAVDLIGDYVVNGENMDKTTYKGALFVERGDVDQKYLLKWRTGSEFAGFGIQSGPLLAGTFGPAKCGVVAYSVDAEQLTGRWSFARGGFGTERAKKSGE